MMAHGTEVGGLLHSFMALTQCCRQKGKWFLGSVGTCFTPLVNIIQPGEDVAARIMAFSQQGQRAVCIISATGAVYTATLPQDSDSGGVVTYEGGFEILCLSESYLVLDDGGTWTRSGGLHIALCGPDHHRVISGSVGPESSWNSSGDSGEWL